MDSRQQIKNQVARLLSYFPGRGRFSLAWLIILPAISYFTSNLFFRNISRSLSSPAHTGIPYALMLSFGEVVDSIYFWAVLICLIRINHSQRTQLKKTIIIIFSSIIYGVIIGLPGLAVTAIWALPYAGLTISGLLQGIAGIILVSLSAFLLVALLGLAAHYIGLFIPFLLLLLKTYGYLLPVSYSLNAVPEPWRTTWTTLVPLAPEITILRNSFLGQAAATSGQCWMAALFHGAIGVAVMVWLWKEISNPETGESSIEPAPMASPV